MEPSKLSKFKFKNLLFDQQNCLVNELLKCDSLKERLSRTRIIEALMSPIPNQVEREGKPRDVVFSILKECDSSDNAFLSFLDVLKQEEGRNEIYDKLTTLTHQLLVIKEIYDLLNESSKNSILDESGQINELYKNSLPVKEFKELEGNAIIMAIHSLSGFSRNPNETFPLLKFIKLFKFNEEDSNKLSSKLIKLVKELLPLYISNLSTDDINHIENFNFLQNSKEDKNSQSDSLDLLIEIKVEEPRNKSKRASAKKYRFSFYEWKSIPKKLDCISNIAEKDIQSTITLKLEEYFQNSDDVKSKIHFFLPTNLMCLDVDQWEYNFNNDKSILSQDNYVILRALANRPGRHKNQVLDRLKSKPIKSLPIKEKIGLKPKLLREEDVNFIIFSFPLSHKDTDLFEAISYTGMPIAVWIRESSAHVDFCYDKLKFDQEKDMNSIIKAVRKLRLCAREEEDRKGEKKHFGSHISLVWEDPERTIDDIINSSTAMTPKQSSSLKGS